MSGMEIIFLVVALVTLYAALGSGDNQQPDTCGLVADRHFVWCRGNLCFAKRPLPGRCSGDGLYRRDCDLDDLCHHAHRAVSVKMINLWSTKTGR